MADLTTLSTLTTTIFSPIATTTPPPTAAAAMATALRRDGGDDALTLTSCSYQPADPSDGISSAPWCVCDGGATTLPPLSITTSVASDDQSCQYTTTVARARARARQEGEGETAIPASVMTSTGGDATLWQPGGARVRDVPTESVKGVVSSETAAAAAAAAGAPTSWQQQAGVERDVPVESTLSSVTATVPA